MSYEPQGPDPDQLSQAYQRARKSPALIASLIAAWELAFDGDVADTIGMDKRHLPSLALCLRPRPDSWGGDVQEIAREHHLDPGQLANFLRQAFVVEQLAGSPATSAIVDGRLLAARDKGQEPEE